MCTVQGKSLTAAVQINQLEIEGFFQLFYEEFLRMLIKIQIRDCRDFLFFSSQTLLMSHFIIMKHFDSVLYRNPHMGKQANRPKIETNLWQKKGGKSVHECCFIGPSVPQIYNYQRSKVNGLGIINCGSMLPFLWTPVVNFYVPMSTDNLLLVIKT